MLHYRRYGIVLPGGVSFAEALAGVFQIVDATTFGPARVGFLFDDAPGGAGCRLILERFLEFSPFATNSTVSPFPGVPASLRLSNLDGRWQGGNPDASGEPSRESLLAAAAGIPAEFPVWIATILIGPVRWNDPLVSEVALREASARVTPIDKPPFSPLSPSMTYLASGVILQRLSTGGLRLWITIQLPDAALSETAAIGPIQKFVERFGPAQTDSLLSVPEAQEVRDAPPLAADPIKTHAGYKSRMAEIVAGLSFPFQIPGPTQFGQLPHAPLGKIRSVIADAFKKDGWKRVAGKIPAGSHKLWKQTPAGRRLELSFDTGSWSRHVVCSVALMSERGAARLPVAAGPSLGFQYLTPNPEIFAQVLENIRVVVAHLESTWVAEMDAALGPVRD